MKKLFYLGLTALLMFFAFGSANAQTSPTLTFDPPAGEVTAGQEITITCSDEELQDYIVFKFYADKATAEAKAEEELEDDGDGVYWQDTETPTVTAEAPVLAAATWNSSFDAIVALTYAEYTVKAAEEDAKKDITVTFSAETWEIGKEIPTVTVNLGESGLTLEDQQLAVRVSLQSNGGGMGGLEDPLIWDEWDGFLTYITSTDATPIDVDGIVDAGSYNVRLSLVSWTENYGGYWQPYENAEQYKLTTTTQTFTVTKPESKGTINVTWAGTEWFYGGTVPAITVSLAEAQDATLGTGSDNIAIEVIFTKGSETKSIFLTQETTTDWESEPFLTPTNKKYAGQYQVTYKVVTGDNHQVLYTYDVKDNLLFTTSGIVKVNPPIVTVSLSATEWTIGSEEPLYFNIAIEPENALTLEGEGGDLAVEYTWNGQQKYLTQKQTAINTEDFTTEGNQQFTAFKLVNSSNHEEAYSGDGIIKTNNTNNTTSLVLKVNPAAQSSDKAKVAVTLTPQDYTVGDGDITFTVTVTPSDKVTLGNQTGNMAVKVTLTDPWSDTKEMVLTQATTTGWGTWFSEDNEWTLSYELVKGDDDEAAFEGEAEMDLANSTQTWTVKAASQGGELTSLKAPKIMTTRYSESLIFEGDLIMISSEDDDEDIEFWYTLDESTPEKDGATSELYDAPITPEISEGTLTVKAIAVKDELTSAVTTVTFSFPEKPDFVLHPITNPEQEVTSTYGKYVDLLVGVSQNNRPVRETEVYYTTDGETEPSMSGYNEYNPECKVKRAGFNEGYELPTIVLTEDAVSLKVIAYVITDEVVMASDVKSFELTARTIEGNPDPILDPAAGATAEKVTVTNADKFSMILYTTDGSIPTYGRLVSMDENVFTYNDGINIEANVTLHVVGFAKIGTEEEEDDPMAGSTADLYGSNMVTGSYKAVQPEDDEDAPVLTFTPDNSKPVGYNTEILISGADGYMMEYATCATMKEAKSKNWGDLYQAGNYPTVTTEEPILVVWVFDEFYTEDYKYYRIYDVNPASDVEKPVILYQGNTTAPEIGLYSKGQKVSITAPNDDYTIWYTIDGSQPEIDGATSIEGEGVVEHTLEHSVIIKAIAVKSGKASDVVTGHFPIYEEATATLGLIDGMRKVEGIVGKNSAIKVTFECKESNVARRLPFDVYYTTDGETEPTAEAYVEGGAIKKVVGTFNEYGSPADANIIVSDETATLLKVKAYLEVDLGDEVNTLVSQTLNHQLERVISGLEVPEFSIEAGKVKVGDTLRITNPNPYESDGDDDDFFDPWGSTAPVPQIYFSLNGELPTNDKYGDVGVFHTDNMDYEDEVLIIIQEDEKGMYAYVPLAAAYRYQQADIDTIRFENGRLYIQAICYGSESIGEDEYGLETYVSYGSDFVGKYYVTGDEVAAPTFNPAAGEVEKGTKVAITCATEGATIYYTVNGEEP
ncbi:MAG: chitobiase/beta-hexosaminidase C-terminal domain-containing protein, partial [Lentimicrobiaceae bacterium]|nr:chitobiase/beta-hexosaminidase C-terminal domain-containing protein [Lentimicrobiaceae bacterium]